MYVKLCEVKYKHVFYLNVFFLKKKFILHNYAMQIKGLLKDFSSPVLKSIFIY